MRVVVTGSSGLLGGWVVEELSKAGDDVVAYGGPSRGASGIDLTDADAVSSRVSAVSPDVVLHTAALSALGDCAGDPERARKLNVEGTANVARACAAAGARLVHVSTDLVFDGEHAPYVETSAPAPTSVYGRTKLEAEGEALLAPNAAVVRVSLLFGPTKNGRLGFFDSQLLALSRGEPVRLFEDEWRTPLSLRAAAVGLRAVAAGSYTGVMHLGGPERLSRYEMGVALASVLGISTPSIRPASRLDIGRASEPRARDVSLDSSLFRATFGAIPLPFRDECQRFRRARSSG